MYEAVFDSNVNDATFYAVNPIFQAKFGTSLAAVLLDQSPVSIRVYYQEPSFALQEQAFNGTTWSKGASLPSSNVSSITSLGAIGWTAGGETQVRVYYQKTDSTLGEIAFTGSSWTQGASFSNQAFPETGIAPILLRSALPTDVIRVYYQGSHLSFHELAFDGTKWSDGTINVSNEPPAPGAGITAVEWDADDGSGGVDIRVYYETDTGSIVQVPYQSASGWGTAGIVSNVKAGFRTPIASTLWGTASALHIRLYLQSSGQSGFTQIAYESSSNSFTSGLIGF